MEHPFYKCIITSTAHRPVRDRLSGEALGDSALFRILIETALNPDDQNHYKECWILELALEVEIDLLREYLSQFCNLLPVYKHDGAIRSISKICLFVVQRNLKSHNRFLDKHQRQQITEAGLIG